MAIEPNGLGEGLARKMPDHDKTSVEEKLEQGLEESMAGSDPVSITQPTASGRDTESDKR